jgi:tetratricopeptide (TPR) repeat protein
MVSKLPKAASACIVNKRNYVGYMRRPQLISQGTLARLLQTADEARKRRDFQQCVEILGRANRLDPANVNILLNLAYAYGKQFDYAASERFFERAIRIASNKAETLAGAGLRARDFGNHKMAEHYYRLAAEQKDATPDTLVALAEISERNSRLEEAAQWIDRAQRLKPNFPAAVLVRARLERPAGRLVEAEAILKSFPADSNNVLQAQAHYELGGILDRQGHYDEAMSAFLKAKTLLTPYAEPHFRELQIVRERLQKMKDGLSTEMLQRWFNGNPVLEPPRRLALLGGHPRSGTTLLEQILDSHPNVVSLEETTIFHDAAYLRLTRGLPDDAPILTVLEGAQTEALQQSRDQYFRFANSFIGQPIGDRLLVDKNPSLTFLIPPLIRIFPEVKLLIALRDPRDVVLSCFMQPLPLEQGSAAYLSLESTVKEYTELMGLWRTLKPLLPNPHLEVRYEDMVSDLESAARRTLDFLGVTWDERVLQFHEHARQKIVRSPTYADVTKPVYKRSVGRWRNYQKYLEPYLEQLEPFVKVFGY